MHLSGRSGRALAALVFVVAWAGVARAVPFHSPVVDGTITANAATDWDPADLVVNDTADDNTSARTANVRRLWCTWDADNLYFAVTYQDWSPDEALAVYVDLDTGTGPRSAAGLDFAACGAVMPDGHGIDLILARNPTDSDAGLGSPAPQVRLVAADSTTTDISADVTVAQGFNTGTAAQADGTQASIAFYFNAEFALPWTAIYPDGMPDHAVIKAVALIAKGTTVPVPVDPAPDNTAVDAGTGLVLLANLAPSVVDDTGDGVPDPSDASVSGTATLPGDDGTAPLVATAVLTGFAGRDPGAPLSRTTTAVGVRTYTLPRLPAGTYEVTLSAEGYLPATTTVTVAEGEAVGGVDLTLAKATAIRGTVGFASGPGAPGTVTLLDAVGAVLATHAFTVAGGPYVFYVESGSYTVRAEADTYLPDEIPVTVVAGTDVTGVDFSLVRQTEISGTVAFASGTGAVGTVRLLDSTGAQVDFKDFPITGGPFVFFRPEGGHYTLSASARTYITTTLDLDVTTGVDVTGLQLVLPRAAFVTGTMAFEGPAASGLLAVYDDVSGARADTLAFATDGAPFGFYLEPGRYRFEADAPGYLPLERTVDVGLTDLDVGPLQLTAIRADHLEIVDADGVAQTEVRGTVSLPLDGKWFPAPVRLAARDSAGRDDLYDLAGALQDFQLSARKMDDLSPPRGTVVFWTDPDTTTAITSVDFRSGRATFWMTDTAVEVLRVYLAQPAKDPVAGRIIVAFQDPEPKTVVLTASADTLVAEDGATPVTVTAKLYDSAGNPSLEPDVPVTFAADPSSIGVGQFDAPTVLTNGDGEASTQLRATGAGPLRLTASVVVNNRVLEVVGGALDSGDDVLTITVVAGEAAGWRLSLAGTVSALHSPVAVTAQLVDAFGNAKQQAGEPLSFTADPADLGSFNPASTVSDTAGRGQTVFTPSGTAGLVTLTSHGGALGNASAGLQLRDVFVVTDPVWYDEPRTRQVFPPVDLTALIVDNTPDELVLEIPFQSDWNALQLHVIFETGFDAAGATLDPFQQPVNYGQADKPDYAITCKYSSNDYGDFRRWNKVLNQWEWYDPGTGTYNGNQGYNIESSWTTKSLDTFTMRVPFAAFGGRPDSLRMEAYITQDENSVKRSAFDSVPQDSTLNLTFDYTNPGPNDWNAALGPVTLHAWSPVYTVKTDFPTPPVVSEATVTPSAVDAGAVVVLSARVADAGDGIGDVLADLSAMGGGSLVRMYDDGSADHGDAAAGDGVYSLRAVVPPGNPGGRQDLEIRAFDAGNEQASRASVTLLVTAIIEPVLHVTDPVGDDHGPNQAGTAGKYYLYPTNIVFGPGSFDLTDLTVFETTAVVNGESIDMIAFQVGIGDFPDPAAPGTADWNPLYAEINIQKIDIMIDSDPGGATATVPNRQAAFQPWDAWDYAVIIDGWYKAVIPSLGQNLADNWSTNAKRTDQDILLLSDPGLNTITALVSKEDLGNPTSDDIRSWDIAVCMMSHDGDASFGGVRWVNDARSEWQFGGGDNGNSDSNIIDLMLIPGSGHQPGLSQEEVLDYESPQALARQANKETPVAIEMSQFEDTGPPVVDTGAGKNVVTQVAPLTDAPLAVNVHITDDYRVDHAVFRYRSTSFAGDGWDREVPMGSLTGDRWVTDILPSWLDSNLVYSPIDSSRFLEFEVQAWDPLGKTTQSPVTTLEILPGRSCRDQGTPLAPASGAVGMLAVDGSTLQLSEQLRYDLVAGHVAQAWTGEAVRPDTMGAHVELRWDLCDVPPVVKTAPQVPPGQPLGIFRQVFLATADTLGGLLDVTGRLPATAELALHYPQPWLPAGADEQKIGIYEYKPASDRWVLTGGNVNPTGNNVTATVDHAGIYGLFLSEGLDYSPGDVISGITISPDPFSPNGDGLYDETNISFYLDREATVTVEIYNVQGKRRQVLTQTFPYTGANPQDRVPRRVPGLIWDGRDSAGKVVPYGIYVLRILTTFNQADGTRTVRNNASLVVIK